MNVIVTNKYKEMLMSLDIEVIKSIEGVFTADELISTFENFFFNKMILDITAIKDYQDTNNLQKLSMGLDMNKVILVLDNETSSKTYLSKLISMGVYNFTRNVAGINYLLVHPHTYRDVVHLHNIQDPEPAPQMQQQQPTQQIINTIGETVYVESPRLNIIGIKSLTIHSGATTLTYLMKKSLEQERKVVALEVNKNDFIYFQDNSLISTTSTDLAKELMKHQDYEIALIDLNNHDDIEICSDILYLVEPSIIKLNRLMRKDKNIFTKLKDKKIVLIQSLLTEKDIAEFEYESKIKIYANIPPVNDRKENLKPINQLLAKMGLIEGKD